MHACVSQLLKCIKLAKENGNFFLVIINTVKSYYLETGVKILIHLPSIFVIFDNRYFKDSVPIENKL